MLEWKNTTRNNYLVDNPVKIEILLAHDIAGFYQRFEGVMAVKIISYLKTIGIVDYNEIRNLFIDSTFEDHEVSNAYVSYMLYPKVYFTVIK